MNQRKLVTLLLLLFGLLLLGGIVWAQSSANYRLRRQLLSNAGGEMASTNYGLRSSMGQSSAIGASGSVSYSLDAGYWHARRSPAATFVTGVTIHGPTTGWVNTTYRFTTTVSPITAAAPITYVWTPTPESGQGKSRATYVWPTEGEEPITVTAQNAGGVATDTHLVVISRPVDPCPAPLESVTLLGPTAGYTGTDFVFTAVISPAEATLPFTYTWAPTPESGQGKSVVTYPWDVTGSRSIAAFATNCGATVSDTQTVTIQPRPPAVGGDAYEPDDTCGAQTTPISTSGLGQGRTFHDQADEDWVPFTVTAGVTYVVQARVPPTSTADVLLELYEGCGQAPGGEQDPVFGPDARLTFVAPTGGTYYVRLRNDPSSACGVDAAYQRSVRALRESGASGAVVIVAGKREDEDPLQENIHHVTDTAYRFASSHGCATEQIYYLAADAGLPGVNDAVTTETLKYALTEWAADKVGPDSPLTLFMMDHGRPDEFYLNGSDAVVTPEQLDSWLEQLETQTGAEVNVVMEACNSGSFIEPERTVSREGRVVIASTKNQALAYASREGAVFSDAFFDALEQEMSLQEAFQDAAWSAGQSHPDQMSLLDDDGDGSPNGAQDGAVAAQRGFACTVAPPDEQSPPHVAQVEVKRLRVDKGRGEIWAQVEDDREVKRVWAVVYAPSYRPPEPGDSMAEPLLELTLQEQGNDWYGSLYAAFDEIGEYRVMVYAEDDEGLDGRPQELKVSTGQEYQVYLPLVLRE